MLTNDSAFPATAHEIYAQWRRSARVHRMQTPDGHPVWVVTSYDDVRRLFTDERLSIDKRHARDGYTGFSLPPTLDANLLNVDSPDHTRLRRLVTAVFTSRRVQQMRPMVEKHVEQLLDKLNPRRQADLVAQLAVPLPLAVIGELLGFDDLAQMRSWTDALIAPGPHQPHTPRQAITAMEQYIRDLIARRRRQPDASLTSALIGVREGSDELSDDELTSLVFLLIWAGYETTIDALSTCLLSVLRQLALRDKLRDHPGDIEQAVEEMLRLDGPTPFSIRRFAIEDITIGDSTIAAGDTVLLLIAAANRDPYAFEEPDRQLIGRDPNPHLAFGRGVHHCLGAPLARLEIATTIAQLIRAFPAARLAVAPEELSWRPSFRARGLTELPVLLNA